MNFTMIVSAATSQNQNNLDPILSFYKEISSEHNYNAKEIRHFQISIQDPEGAGCRLKALLPIRKEDNKKRKVCLRHFAFSYQGPSQEGISYRVAMKGNIEDNPDNTGEWNSYIVITNIKFDSNETCQISSLSWEDAKERGTAGDAYYGPQADYEFSQRVPIPVISGIARKMINSHSMAYLTSSIGDIVSIGYGDSKPSDSDLHKNFALWPMNAFRTSYGETGRTSGENLDRSVMFNFNQLVKTAGYCDQ